MKKMITWILTLAMAAALLCAGPAAAEENDLTGTWYLQSMMQEGVEVDSAVLATMGMTMVLTLNEDGTASMDVVGEIEEGTWSFDGEEGALNIGSSPTMKLEGDLLVLTAEESASMTFGREPASVKDAELAPAVEDPQPEDYCGLWKATKMVYFGIQLPFEMMATNLQVMITEGAADLQEDQLDMNAGFEVTDSNTYQLKTEVKEDGTLFIDFDDATILQQLGSAGSGLSLSLREDGTMTGVIPEFAEAIEMMKAMGESSEEEAEGAEEAAEIFTETDEFSDESSGSSGESASVEAGMEMYILFEKIG